ADNLGAGDAAHHYGLLNRTASGCTLTVFGRALTALGRPDLAKSVSPWRDAREEFGRVEGMSTRRSGSGGVVLLRNILDVGQARMLERSKRRQIRRIDGLAASVVAMEMMRVARLRAVAVAASAQQSSQKPVSAAQRRMMASVSNSPMRIRQQPPPPLPQPAVIQLRAALWGADTLRRHAVAALMLRRAQASGSGGGGGVGSGNGSALADYEVVEVIGRGSSETAPVLLGKRIDFGDMCDVRKQMLLTEINLIIQLRHCNIVRCYNYIIDREAKRAYIIMEYCPNGDLAALIKQHRRDKCQSGAAPDLKPANCFLDAGRSIKLGDFGLARVLAGDASFASTYLGTPYYMSPEQILRRAARPAFNSRTACRPMSCRSPACAAGLTSRRRLADSLGRLRRLLKSRERELDARAAAADEREARLAKREAEVDSSDKENTSVWESPRAPTQTRLLQLPHLSQHPMLHLHPRRPWLQYTMKALVTPAAALTRRKSRRLSCTGLCRGRDEPCRGKPTSHWPNWLL
uniref:non-specific serine/threonine protein kinase n=1 Tax=Macrostomum lignano TaxID=282301 RepID=A0A1I8FF88_9PLAT